MITLTNSQRSVELPDLEWVDKYEWTSVRENVRVTVTGSLVIQTAKQISGRYITLQGGDDYGWLTSDQLSTLWQMVEDNETMTLTMPNGLQYQVRFRYGEGPISADPLWPFNDKFGNVTIRLMEVES